TVDKTCKERTKDSGLKCVATAYPKIGIMMGIGYLASFAGADIGGCPAANVCADMLQECVESPIGLCRGSDYQDCMDAGCRFCFEQADYCVYKASADCQEKSFCGDGKCIKFAGETEENCCMDCGCPWGKYCVENKCKSKPTETTLFNPIVPTTIRGEPQTRDEAQRQLENWCDIPYLMGVLSLLMAAIGKILFKN
ncbi:MAG: hypothetical protein KKD39_08985, partial [Candidatus Altiarchaeota archaeon]|nr:hypothetical protein [Candidatus Altiarchaeota archaeon]